MNLGFRIPTEVESEPADRAVDLRKYLNFIWRHWIFILCLTALSLLVAVIYLASATPLYTATTQVLLEQRERAPTGDPGPNEGRIDTFWYVDNQLAILRSNSLLRRVVIKERLAPENTEEAQVEAQAK